MCCPPSRPIRWPSPKVATPPVSGATAWPTLDLNRGQLHGRLPGYAVMNQSSLPCFISLLLADKCGIKHPEIQAGIEQTHTFYADFIGKGTLPYGVHNPNAKSFNNNGMSGLAAVAFVAPRQQGGRRLLLANVRRRHHTMEHGHTGHFFNQIWTGLGANLAGPEASAAFFKRNPLAAHAQPHLGWRLHL